MRRNIPTIIIEERMLLREGIAALLHGTCYKVIANVASVSEIPYLKLSPGRPLLTILGLLRGRDETLRAVQDVRQAVKVVKLVAVGESLRDDFREINDDGIDAIVFNVGSSDALLKVLDLVLIGQQIVILAPPLESEPVNHTVGHAPTGTIARSGAATESGTKRVGEMLVSSLNSQLSERQQQVLICVARGESNKMIARSCSITEATVKVHLQSILRKISARNRTEAALWAVENGLVSRTVQASNGLLPTGWQPF